MKYELYWKNRNEAQRAQVGKKFSSTIYIKPFTAVTWTQPLHVKIGQKAVSETERFVNESSSRKISWKSRKRDDIESAIGCLQLFSDKSHVSMSAGSFMFYLMHITLLKILEEMRRKHISSGRTVRAGLPVRFDFGNDSTDFHDVSNESQTNRDSSASRTQMLSAICKSIGFSLPNASRHTHKELKWRTGGSKHFFPSHAYVLHCRHF